jgi:hypothetical protein
MLSKRIEGATRDIGKSQGYIGLAVRDELQSCTVNGDETPVMVTAWEPTPDEMARLAAGGSVLLHVLGSVHPPVRVEVSYPAMCDELREH